MTDRIYTVTGMTCQHCVDAVTGEIGKLDGVASVLIDLPSGAVTVVGDGYTDDQIRGAVDEAGYEVASA